LILKAEGNETITVQTRSRAAHSSCTWVIVIGLIAHTCNIIALDLEEVSLVDLDIVQLLDRCEAKGMELLNCPPYIREWISRESSRATSKK